VSKLQLELEGFSLGQWRGKEEKCISWPQAAKYNMITNKMYVVPVYRNWDQLISPVIRMMARTVSSPAVAFADEDQWF
jgi:hypothetical protein